MKRRTFLSAAAASAAALSAAQASERLVASSPSFEDLVLPELHPAKFLRRLAARAPATPDASDPASLVCVCMRYAAPPGGSPSAVAGALLIGKAGLTAFSRRRLEPFLPPEGAVPLSYRIGRHSGEGEGAWYSSATYASPGTTIAVEIGGPAGGGGVVDFCAGGCYIAPAGEGIRTLRIFAAMLPRREGAPPHPVDAALEEIITGKHPTAPKV